MRVNKLWSFVVVNSVKLSVVLLMKMRANFALKKPRMFFATIVVSLFYGLFLPTTSFGAVIFQDNFDNNCSGQACNVSGGTNYYPTGWMQWMSDGISATHDSVTHYSGEITSPGRSGSGKSLKLWRHSNSWIGSASYAGSLVYILNGSYSDFYFRTYVKMPTELNMYDGIGTKLWRFNTTAGDVYININPVVESGGHRGNSVLAILTSQWTTLLNSSQLLNLWDGQWHAWQFRFNLSAGTVTFWADGVQLSQVSVPGLTGSWGNNYLQHFPLGNCQADSWQNSWQAFEVDDFVIATTKAETDPVGGSPDTTPPTVSITAPASGAAVSGSVTISATASDNVGVAGVQFKLNGNNLDTEDTSSPYSISWGTTSVSNGTHTLTATARDDAGNSTTSSSITVTVNNGIVTFFSEGYEDTNFASRGWYDITTGTVDTAEHHSGNASIRCTYTTGGTDCTAPKRHKFTESDSVYVSYWVKYSSNFVGSGVGYHPHEFYFLTNLNGDYDGLAFDYLTLYLESHWSSSSSGVMQVGFQDGQNVDQSRIGQNLIGVTENRAVAGCNGSPSGYSGGCYDRGDGVYVNGVMLSSSQTFTTANKNNWNHVEAYYRLNSISNGIGQADGIIRVWFNNSLVFERTNAILRTGQRSTMKLNQFIFGPWIGDGSPVNQTMWIDDLVVASARASSNALSAPTNFRIIP